MLAAASNWYSEEDTEPIKWLNYSINLSILILESEGSTILTATLAFKNNFQSEWLESGIVKNKGSPQDCSASIIPLH
jgi:hypothetical protein